MRSNRSAVPYLLTAAALSLASSGTVHGQGRGAPAPAPYVFEYSSSFRALYARQNPRFVPFRETRATLRVDSLRTDTASRDVTYRVSFLPTLLAVTNGVLTTRSNGAIVRATASPRITAGTAPGRPGVIDSSPSERSFVERTTSAMVPSPRLLMPSARLWHVVPVVAATEMRAGAVWLDTLNLASNDYGYSQSIAGVRKSVVQRDTIVDNRRHWIVEDSASVRMTESFAEREYTLGAPVTTRRTTTGVIRGRYVFDPESRLFRTRIQSTALRGEATLMYPDRSLTSSVRIEDRESWTLYNSSQYAVYQDSVRAAAARGRGGMVIMPGTVEQERLARGDLAYRDSLVRTWDSSQDADQRARLYQTITTWGSRGDTAFVSRLLERALAAGDTALWLDAITRQPREIRRWDVQLVRNVLLPLAADPGSAFALGISRDRFFETTAGLILNPIPSLTADTSAWALRPSVLDLLAQQWPAARDSRLRALGLLANLGRDPRRWSDTVLANVNVSPWILTPAVTLIKGIGATWPAASKQSLPAPDATWRDWLEWMGGRSPDYPVPASIVARSNPQYPELRFEASHANAIRFYEARTGRAVTAELQRGAAAATSDSARLVYLTMLTALGAVDVQPAEIERQVRSGSPAMLNLARRTLPQIFATAARTAGSGFAVFDARTMPANTAGGVHVADSAVAAALLDRWIDSQVKNEQPWVRVEQRVTGLAPAAPVAPSQQLHAPLPPSAMLTVLSENIPQSIVDKWRGRVQFITRTEMADLDQRAARQVFMVGPILQAAQFVSFTADYSERVARAANEAPQLYAGGTRYYLMLLDNEWVLVTGSSWVT